MTYYTCDGCSNPMDKDEIIRSGKWHQVPWDVCKTCRDYITEAFRTHTLRAHLLKENNGDKRNYDA